MTNGTKVCMRCAGSGYVMTKQEVEETRDSFDEETRAKIAVITAVLSTFYVEGTERRRGMAELIVMRLGLANMKGEGQLNSVGLADVKEADKE